MATGLCLLGVQSSSSPVLASVTVTCSGPDSTHTLTVDGNGSAVVMSRTFGGDIVINHVTCGSVTTVDTVNISGLPTTVGQGVILDLANGLFAPGATLESDGSSEIEFNVTMTPNVTEFVVADSPQNDQITVGDRLAADFTLVTDLNLNGFADLAGTTSHLDNDVTIHGAPGRVNLAARGGVDTLSGQGTGVAGSRPTVRPMILTAHSGNDTLLGGVADDTLYGDDFTPGDTFRGGAGSDSLSFIFSGVELSLTQDGVANDGTNCPGLSCEGDDVGSDVESLTTGSGNDTIAATAGPQVLDAGSGNNELTGGPGNDMLMARKGADDFAGGPGFDVVSYTTHDAGMRASLDGVANDGVTGELDNVRADVEAVVGSFFNDVLIGNDNPNRLTGLGGNDVLRGLGNTDTLDGGGIVNGSTQPADGSDAFFGGTGIDTALETGHSAGLTLSLDDVANDRLTGSSSEGVDNIHSDVENVTGGPFADSITGSSLANKLAGAGGNDTLIGLGGNDVLVPGGGLDNVQGGVGVDEVSYLGAGAVTVNLTTNTATGQGNDTLSSIERATGSIFGDHLTGSSVANVLHGGEGNDTLAGLAANDQLLGEGANDSMDGGTGTDTCVQGPGTGPKTSCEL